MSLFNIIFIEVSQQNFLEIKNSSKLKFTQKLETSGWSASEELLNRKYTKIKSINILYTLRSIYLVHAWNLLPGYFYAWKLLTILYYIINLFKENFIFIIVRNIWFWGRIINRAMLLKNKGRSFFASTDLTVYKLSNILIT